MQEYKIAKAIKKSTDTKKCARMQRCRKQCKNAKVQECREAKSSQRMRRSNKEVQECGDAKTNTKMQRCKKQCKNAKMQKGVQECKPAKNDAKKKKARVRKAMQKKKKYAKVHMSMQECNTANCNPLPYPPPSTLPCPVSLRSSPGVKVCQRLEGLGGTDELVEDADDIGKLGAPAALLLPALHHQLVDGGGTIQGSGEAEALVDGLHHLRGGEGRSVVLLPQKAVCLQEPPPPQNWWWRSVAAHLVV